MQGIQHVIEQLPRALLAYVQRGEEGPRELAGTGWGQRPVPQGCRAHHMGLSGRTKGNKGKLGRGRRLPTK